MKVILQINLIGWGSQRRPYWYTTLNPVRNFVALVPVWWMVGFIWTRDINWQCPGKKLCNTRTSTIRLQFSLIWNHWGGGSTVYWFPRWRDGWIERIDECFTGNGSLLLIAVFHLASGSCGFFTSQRWWNGQYYVRHWFMTSVTIGVQIEEEMHLGSKLKAYLEKAKTKDKQSRKKKACCEARSVKTRECLMWTDVSKGQHAFLLLCDQRLLLHRIISLFPLGNDVWQSELSAVTHTFFSLWHTKILNACCSRYQSWKSIVWSCIYVDLSLQLWKGLIVCVSCMS